MIVHSKDWEADDMAEISARLKSVSPGAASQVPKCRLQGYKYRLREQKCRLLRHISPSKTRTKMSSSKTRTEMSSSFTRTEMSSSRTCTEISVF